MKTALILDGHLRSALSAVRSLGACGYTVVCGSPRLTGLARYSRWTARAFSYPSPISSLSGFCRAVQKAAEGLHDLPLIYSFSDATTLALSRLRGMFHGVAVLVLPDPASVETSFDKRQTVAIAQELGIAVPPTYDIISHVTSFPAVIKPRHNVTWNGDRAIKSEAAIVHSVQELHARWRHMHIETGETPFAQEYIPAQEYGFSVVCDNGSIRAQCAHRRIRSLNPSGGASAVRVTVDPPPGMERASEMLMKKLLWHGPAMVEFRVGRDDGVPYLVEINGRFWGSLALAIRAGVDAPAICADLASGMEIPATGFRRGVYSRYLLGDIAHIVRSGFSRRALCEFFSYRGKDHFYDVESWSDPFPAIVDVIDKMY